MGLHEVPGDTVRTVACPEFPGDACLLRDAILLSVFSSVSMSLVFNPVLGISFVQVSGGHGRHLWYSAATRWCCGECFHVYAY